MEDTVRKKKWPLILGAVIIIAVLAVIIYYFENKNEETGDKVDGYTISVGSYKANFESIDEIKNMLSIAKAKYDPDSLFDIYINEKELSSKGIATANVVKKDGSANMIEYVSMYGEGVGNGFQTYKKLPSGLVGLDFEQRVTIKKASFARETIRPTDEVVSELTKDKDKNQTYTVEPGDCLGIIAQNLDMKLDKLLELNGFENEGEILHVGDELIVSVPEPDLSIITNSVSTKEEEYVADTEYIPNDSWYTTNEVVRREATTGRRVATVSNVERNGRPKTKSLIASVILEESTAAVIEKGTMKPPTYIKPIRGGVFSSGFGARWGTVHKGIDWACGTGTPIMASCDGVVYRSEFSGSYGNVIYINHPDGRQTRYAHMSKRVASAGEAVKQGDIIGYSGNTGNSTGPHLHFEILIGGKQVNPLQYMS